MGGVQSPEVGTGSRNAIRQAGESGTMSGQVAKKQIAVSEPRPILYLSVDRMDGLKVENVGNDLAFDVSVDPMSHKVSTDAGAPFLTITYTKEPLIRVDDHRWARIADIHPNVNERVLRDSTGQTKNTLWYMLESLAVISRSQAQEHGDHPKYPISLIPVTVHYRTQHRAESITRSFMITAISSKTFECVPSDSLLGPELS